MTMIVIMLGIFIMVATVCVGVLVLVNGTVKAMANVQPVIKVVQEYSVVGGDFNDIYDHDGEPTDKDADFAATLDDVLKEVNQIFTDDEVKSNE